MRRDWGGGWGSGGAAGPSGTGYRCWQSWDRTHYCSFYPASVTAEEVDVDATVEEDLGKSREGSRTDDEVVQR